MTTKNSRSGGSAPEQPANKTRVTPPSARSQNDCTTEQRRTQPRSWLEGVALEREYVNRKNAEKDVDYVAAFVRILGGIRRSLGIE